MRQLEKRIDEVFKSDFDKPQEPINEFGGLFKRLFRKPGKADTSKIQPIQGQQSQGPVPKVSEPDLANKESNAPTQHLASYAINRGKGYIRVGVSGDKNLTTSKLHIFKKGNTYHGFLVIPGPGKKKMGEDFSIQIAVIMELDMHEAVSDVVLKFSSDDLGELFDLSKYTKKSSLASNKLSKYDSDIKLLDADTAEKANIGRLPWGKEQREKLGQDASVDIDVSKARELGKKYDDLALKEKRDEVVRLAYDLFGDVLGKVTNREQLDKLISNIEYAISKANEKGDEKSLKYAALYRNMIDSLSVIPSDIEV